MLFYRVLFILDNFYRCNIAALQYLICSGEIIVVIQICKSKPIVEVLNLTV